MTERVDIANMALSFLGANEITSLEDDSEEARQMALHYPLSRDAALEAHEWSFAIKRFIPARLATDPEFGPFNAFKIPADILRVISVDRDEGAYAGPWVPQWGYQQEQADWVIESGNILSSFPAIYCRGIRRTEDEGIYSPLFVKSLAARLAADTAITITHSASIQQIMEGRYRDFIDTAKSRDGLQGRNRRIRNRSLLRAR